MTTMCAWTAGSSATCPEVGFAMVSRWARTGQIRVDGKRADVDTPDTGQVLRVPPAGGRCRSQARARAPVRKPLTEEQIQLAEYRAEQDRAAIVINKPPGLATQGGSGTHEHVDGLLDAYAPDGARARAWSTVSTRIPRACCWSAHAGQRGVLLQALFGRTAPRSIGRW
jgi:23S rRNA-/tRNA-specific pseudouridylate synthase